MEHLLHFNELPLKHLIRELYGKPTGPNHFCGPITGDLRNCENETLLDNFEVIACDFPEIKNIYGKFLMPFRVAYVPFL